VIDVKACRRQYEAGTILFRLPFRAHDDRVDGALERKAIALTECCGVGEGRIDGDELVGRPKVSQHETHPVFDRWALRHDSLPLIWVAEREGVAPPHLALVGA
jgi:hypothetical protein